MPGIGDYLDLTLAAAREQLRSLISRSNPAPGKRQVDFQPVETLLCLSASLMINHRRFGSSTATKAPEPVPSLARLFKRPPSSVLAKMANLDGSRSNGGRWDILAGAILRNDVDRFTHIYRTIMVAARTEGLSHATLPDFLGVEHRDRIELLGQDELTVSLVFVALEEHFNSARFSQFTVRETERIVLGAVRVGQHIFASNVLRNCGHQCVFCGFAPSSFGARRMLVASHIKPWRESTSAERLDHRNGLAACPTHDVAFDTGLLSVTEGLRIQLSRRLQEASNSDGLAARYFGRPPVLKRLSLPDDAEEPRSRYLHWHQTMIYRP